jgi:hypothetical protein
MDILDASGEILSPAAILSQLQDIQGRCEREREGPAVGALTALQRTRFFEVSARGRGRGRARLRGRGRGRGIVRGDRWKYICVWRATICQNMVILPFEMVVFDDYS